MGGGRVYAHEIVAEAREIARDLEATRRALRTDWLRAGNPEPDLMRLLNGVLRMESFEGYPLPIRVGLGELKRLRAQMAALLHSPDSRGVIDLALNERAKVLRTAVRVHKREVGKESDGRQAEILLSNAAASGRALTPRERSLIAALEDHGREFQDELPGDESGAFAAEVIEAVGALRIREARRQLQGGLLLTDQMRGLIRAARPALSSGAPILLIGETGGAKTALAEHLARSSGKSAEFISGYGDISAAQLVGTHELRADGGATVTEFTHGPMLRAMSEGRPLILDEVNAMPAEFLKRLNRILQLRPGAEFAVQEQAGLVVTIAEGFTILATANEHAPHRYRGIEPLSSELVNRFGANTYRVRYPDSGLAYTDYPQENALIAAAALADGSGRLPRGITGDHIEQVARAAFISQQVFSGNQAEGFSGFVTTERELDQQPGLEESVIAPRTLVAILERVALEGTPEAIHESFSRFVDGVMNREDRSVLELILTSQGIAR